MGEYFKPVNLTRKEYVNPHRLDCGLKLPEWNFPGSPVRRRIKELHESGRWSANDDIRALSDYGSEMPLQGDGPELGEEKTTEVYGSLEDDFEDVSRGGR